MRGGEKVLEAILELYPAAEIFTLFHFPGSVSKAIESRRIHTSPLQEIASRIGDYRRLLPLYPAAVEAWSFERYDLVISSSHAVAKGVDTGSVPHVCYCHTPMRYIWDRFDDYFPPRRIFTRFTATVVMQALRNWDRKTAAGVDQFVANSHFVKKRIREFYDRDAVVVHPFVDEIFLQPPLNPFREEHHLMVSAVVPYKKVELAIEAARRRGFHLIVVGTGPLRTPLEAGAPPNVDFLGFVSVQELMHLLATARSLILPGVEDFGITPLEALACGTPVVAYGEGGALETVTDGVTGIFFREASVESLEEALTRVETTRWDRALLRERAAEFSRERFKAELASVVGRTAGGSFRSAE